MYHNWLKNLHQLMPKIVDKILSGEDVGRLVVAVIATIAAYFLIDFVTAPVAGYLSDPDQEFNTSLFLIACAALICAVAVAWVNFAHWLSDHTSQTDTEILANANIEATHGNTSDTYSQHKK